MKMPTSAWAFFLGWYALWWIGSPRADQAPLTPRLPTCEYRISGIRFHSKAPISH